MHRAHSVDSGGPCLLLIGKDECESVKGQEIKQNAGYACLNENVINEIFSYFSNIRLTILLP